MCRATRRNRRCTSRHNVRIKPISRLGRTPHRRLQRLQQHQQDCSNMEYARPVATIRARFVHNTYKGPAPLITEKMDVDISEDILYTVSVIYKKIQALDEEKSA
eukprot:GHVR01016070.1.p2 GENE.GHVR01016070.1~~GHVR01016070.1.p2  ORF type:complete len:104 (-),score=7.26 GHVR01016070.1:550-861(-)